MEKKQLMLLAVFLLFIYLPFPYIFGPYAAIVAYLLDNARMGFKVKEYSYFYLSKVMQPLED